MNCFRIDAHWPFGQRQPLTHAGIAMSYRTAARLLLCAFAMPGCAATGMPWVELGGQHYRIEIADDFQERARGLMFRDAMPADHGMLFIYDQEQPAAFWMKNTKIALDILYFDAGRRLVSLQKRVPPCTLGDDCPAYPSEHPAMYVLEVNAGEADRLALKPGDQLIFSPDVPTTGEP